MRRAEFLTLTGLSVPKYRNMRAAGALPYLRPGDEPESGWTDFGISEAITTAIAIALAEQGLEQSQAATILSLNPPELADYRKVLQGEDGDALIYGVVDIRNGNDHLSEPLRRGFTHPMRTILLAPVPVSARKSEILGNMLDRIGALRIVNVTAIFRSMRAKAQAAGIDFDLGAN